MLNFAQLQPRVTAFSWVIAPITLFLAFCVLYTEETPSNLFISLFLTSFIALTLPRKIALPLIFSLIATAFYLSYPLDLWHLGVASSCLISFYLISNTVEEGLDSLTLISDSSTIQKEAITTVIAEKNKLKEEIVNLCASLTEKDQKINEINSCFEKAEVDLEKQVLNINASLSDLNKELEKLQTELSDKNKELETVQSLRSQLESRNKDFANLKERYKQLEASIPNEEAIKQAIIQEMAEHIDNLEREKGLLENTLSKLQGELETLQEPLTDNMTASEFRRINGILTQLREQFDDKSKILDNTRKDLFHTQEELNVLKKEKSEWELKGGSFVTDLLAKIEEEQEKSIKAESEIIRLEELISNLISRK